MKRARFTAHGILALASASWGLEFAIAAPTPAPFKEAGAFAVVDVIGPLTQRGGWFWDSYEAIRGRVEAALASSSEAVLLRIDSPGGEVAGCFELAEEIRSKAAAAGKRVVAYVDGMACSAAYALACAADRICLPPTGGVGSIGCIKIAVDQSRMDQAMGLTFSVASSGKRKADGNPHVPTSEEAIAAMQTEVDAMAGVFFDLVARARGMASEAVAGLEAGIFLGAQAVAAGLADEVTTFERLLAMGASEATKTTAQAGAEDKEMNEKEKAIAALRALAASKDEAESKAAKAALKAMGVAESDDEEPKAEDKDEEPKAEAEEEAPKSEEKKDDDAKAKASASSDPALALAATVQSLAAWKAEREEKEERAKLMAKRPDFAPEVVALMDRSPLSVVRDAVKNLPRGATPAKGGQVAAARAALGATGIVGEGQGETSNALPEDEARKLDVQMGLAKRTQAIRHEGSRLVLGVMTPAEARAELAKKGATK